MVYEYTKPRVPIAAMYNSPGPCYNLPSLVGHNQHDPRSVHSRAPAYQFGSYHHTYTNNSGPGPCYNVDSKIYKTGKDGSPQYSVYSRTKELQPYNTPGPGTYAPENSWPVTASKSPVHSFGQKYPAEKTSNVPAPNTYSAPPSMGRTIESRKRQSPSYSLYGRSKTGSFHEDLQKTPGPGAYTVVAPEKYKDKSPHYSLTGRNMSPGDSTQKPGPGAHHPENVYITKNQSPRFTFGIRHSDYEAPVIVPVVD